MLISKLKCQRGGAAVEFALTAPLLFAVLFGIGDFGVAMFKKEVLTNAAREGARYGIVLTVPRKTTAQIQTVVKSYLTSGSITSGYTITTPGPCANTGDDLSVSVSYPYAIPVLSHLMCPTCLIHSSSTLPSSVALQTTTVMKCE
jgi:Flp pilus assembly protein TadG